MQWRSSGWESSKISLNCIPAISCNCSQHYNWMWNVLLALSESRLSLRLQIAGYANCFFFHPHRDHYHRTIITIIVMIMILAIVSFFLAGVISIRFQHHHHHHQQVYLHTRNHPSSQFNFPTCLKSFQVWLYEKGYIEPLVCTFDLLFHVFHYAWDEWYNQI